MASEIEAASHAVETLIAKTKLQTLVDDQSYRNTDEGRVILWQLGRKSPTPEGFAQPNLMPGKMMSQEVCRTDVTRSRSLTLLRLLAPKQLE